MRSEIEQLRERAAEDPLAQRTWPSHTFNRRAGENRVPRRVRAEQTLQRAIAVAEHAE